MIGNRFLDVDVSDIDSVFRAWLQDREDLLAECDRLQRQRDKARRWALNWKYAAIIKRSHYLLADDYLEKEREAHRVTRDYYRDFVPQSRYPR